MTKETAFDTLTKLVTDCANCWEADKPEDAVRMLAYLTGIFEFLNAYFEEYRE